MNEEVQQSRLRISRRRALMTGGAVSFGGLLAACSARATPNATPASSTAVVTESIALLDAAPTCITTKADVEGPYWFNVDDIRSDIREDRPGTPLTVAMRVLDTSNCAAGGKAMPVTDAVVEVWQCDVGGIYSGFELASANPIPAPEGGIVRPPPGVPNPFADALSDPSHGEYSVGDTQTPPVDDSTYLRGAQITDAAGIVHFATIFPGWYFGRTVHIHFKVHRDKATVLTAQMYFDEDVIAAAHSVSPYSEHVGRDTRNDNDAYFDAGALATVATTPAGQIAALNIGIASLPT